MEFQLRKANQDDSDLLWSLRVVTMKDLITEAYGWDEGLQYMISQESLKGKIVLVNAEAVGVLTLSDWDDQLHLTWLAILPIYQHQGLGTRLINYCQQQAVRVAKPLTLQVLRNNSAILLYQRCGFEIYDQSDAYKLRMRWRP